jgi:hypothetical protein
MAKKRLVIARHFLVYMVDKCLVVTMRVSSYIVENRLVVA